jgi:hypothetical protein
VSGMYVCIIIVSTFNFFFFLFVTLYFFVTNELIFFHSFVLVPDIVAAPAQCRARPLSPSRVILARFFRGSRSSTRVTG